MQKRSLLYIGNKLSKKGSSVSTIDTLSSLLMKEGLIVFSASSVKNKLFRILDMLLTIVRYSKRVSLVIIDTYSTQNFYYAVIVAKLCRMLNLAYIPILHGGNLPERLLKSPKLSQSLFNKSRINIAPSNYLLEAFKERGFHNVTYIPNTIEINKYPFLLRKNLQPKLLWVRAFAHIYNPTLAIEVLKKLQSIGINTTLTMVGPDKDGSLEKCKQLAADYKLSVKFTGKLEKNEWIALSEEHDIFINTTNFDNMPVSVIEAMALGLPVISTKVGGMPYLIDDGKTGLLVPPDNSQSFVESIQLLLENPDLVKSLTTNARIQVEEYDWEKVKNKWLELIR